MTRATPPNAARGRGFTLLELMLALTLLALLMAGAWAGVSTASRALDRGEDLIDRTNTIRVAQEFLRRELSQALALPIEQDPATGESVLFAGASDEVTFVAPMPGYLGRGGAYVQRLRLEQQDGDLRLTFRHVLLNGYDADDRPLDDPDLEPVVLLDRIADARFSYRALDDQGELEDWTDEWDTRGRTPLLVRLEIEFLPESRMRWPELVIPLRFDPAIQQQVRDPFYAPFTGG